MSGPNVKYITVPVDVIRRNKAILYRNAKSDKYNCSDRNINKKLNGQSFQEPRNTWKKVNRYVKRGGKGTAINPYVFDISDTDGKKRNLTWSLEVKI